MSRFSLRLTIRPAGFRRIHAIQPNPRLHDMPRPDVCAYSDRIAINHLYHISSDWAGDAVYTLKVHRDKYTRENGGKSDHIPSIGKLSESEKRHCRLR